MADKKLSEAKMIPRIYRGPQVAQMYNVSEATIKRRVKEGKFPKPLSIGTRAKGWHIDQLQHWENELKKQQEADDVQDKGEAEDQDKEHNNLQNGGEVEDQNREEDDDEDQVVTLD